MDIWELVLPFLETLPWQFAAIVAVAVVLLVREFLTGTPIPVRVWVWGLGILVAWTVALVIAVLLVTADLLGILTVLPPR